ncbi:DNA repair protein RecN [Chlamydiales bacterium STE3]|nr:DNA repair protein RecN [Chlamydiales bacterium STE3]
MIKFLKIHSLILIESMEISFAEGFNVLSGETGSGKSAIMEGLKTLFGNRGDASLVRHGCEKATVEAILDIHSRPDIQKLLQESGIDLDGEELVLKREISINGKNRTFINHQPVQVSLLKRLGSFLFNLVGQHANQMLFSVEEHRQLVDDFAGCSQEVSQFAESWKEEQELRNALQEWQQNEAKRLREVEICKMEISEFEEADLKEGEEEELFHEYSLLSSSEERMQKASEIYQCLTSEKMGLIHLKKQKYNLEQLSKLDEKTSECLKGFSQGICELEEVAHQLRSYLSRQESNPTRLQWVSDRLNTLNKIQKKYGPTLPEVLNYFKLKQQQLESLESSDTHFDALTERLDCLKKHNAVLLERISHQRHQAAALLQEKVTQEIKQLNMLKAEFFISLEKQEINSSGQERIEFFIQPNPGEKAFSIREGASGGELARILLALKTVLAGKEARSILIFDEIDANIGGATASLIGEKLKNLGKVHQVICITHFPQVALFADHHLRIYKKEQDERTVAFVEVLNSISLKDEIARMQGSCN